MGAAYEAKGLVVHKLPVSTPKANGTTSVSVGFPVCTVTEWVGEEGAATVAELLNRADADQAKIAALTEALELVRADFRGRTQTGGLIANTTYHNVCAALAPSHGETP
jgi:hypothetical protein